MRIIFLDVDGVLNNSSTTDKFCEWVGIDPVLVDVLKEIYDESDKEEETRIVVSSSWRYDLINKYYSSDGSYTYLKNRLSEKGMEVIDCTPEDKISGSYRGREILTWLEDNKKKYNVTGWVILDDEEFNFNQNYETKIRFVQTWYCDGLTIDMKDRILDILRGKV